MTQTMQDQFEQAFSDDNGKMPVAFIKLQRLGDSYSVPRVARAWYWFKRSRETLVVDLPDDGLSDALKAWPGRAGDNFDCGYNFAMDRITSAIEATGIKVNS